MSLQYLSRCMLTWFSSILYAGAYFLVAGILQILTDAALLKRQQLEIEELRKKLQVIIY